MTGSETSDGREGGSSLGDDGGVGDGGGDSGGGSDEEEDVMGGESSSMPISSRLSGAINSVRPIARLRALQNQGPPLYPETRVNCHMILAIGLRSSTMPLPVVEATDLGTLL